MAEVTHSKADDERERHIAQLEELVARQQTRIEHLEALLAEQGPPMNDAPEVTGALRANDEELSELRDIVEAQEQAINDQRQIISTQSTLIDELNASLQTQLRLSSISVPAAALPPQAPAVLPGTIGSSAPAIGTSPRSGGESLASSCMADSIPEEPHSAGGRSSASAPSRSRSVRDDDIPASSSVGASGSQRNRRTQGVSSSGRVGGVPMTARSHRDIMLEKQMRQSQQQSPRVDSGRPRPNSAYSRNNASTAPRARSWNSSEQRSGARAPQQGQGQNGSGSNLRTASPTRAPGHGRAQGQAAGSQGASRKNSGRIPPALPMLRQEA